MGHSEVSLGIEGPPPARCQQLSGRLARFRLCACRSEWNSFTAGFAVLYQNEEERPDGKTVVLCALSYVRCCSWGALFCCIQAACAQNHTETGSFPRPKRSRRKGIPVVLGDHKLSSAQQ